MARTCPDCRYPMVTERHHDIDLDFCRNCAGIWFDADELRRLTAADINSMAALEGLLKPRASAPKTQAVCPACPSCASLLRPYHYQYDSPIELNTCEDCGGIWVQEGELVKIQQWRLQNARPGAEEKRGLALAQAEITHEHALTRLESIRWFCGLLRQHPPLLPGNRV